MRKNPENHGRDVSPVRRTLAAAMLATLWVGFLGLAYSLTDDTPTASANGTTTHLQTVGTGWQSDWIFNYDFNDAVGPPVQNPLNVDWGVQFIVYNGATIKDFDTSMAGVYNKTGGPKTASFHDNSSSIVYSRSDGKKQGPCQANVWLRHYRTYAPGLRSTDPAHPNGSYMYDFAWGAYIFGTLHYDINDGCGGASAAGYSKTASGWLAGDLANVYGWSRVSTDAYNMYNPEPSYRYETTHGDWPWSADWGHHWDQSNGLATLVRLN